MLCMKTRRETKARLKRGKYALKSSHTLFEHRGCSGTGQGHGSPSRHLEALGVGHLRLQHSLWSHFRHLIMGDIQRKSDAPLCMASADTAMASPRHKALSISNVLRSVNIMQGFRQIMHTATSILPAGTDSNAWCDLPLTL